MKIILDNGHGAETKGKRSPDSSLLEWKWNREMVAKIDEKLRALGYDTLILVPETEDISLKERCARTNKICSEIGTKNVIFISVHANAMGNGEWNSARGWSAYTSKGQTKSDILAEHLYKAAENILSGMRIRKDKSDGDSDWEENFYVLKNTWCTAVLTENFFYTNKEDLAFLLSDEGKEKIAEVHVQGLVSYIESLQNQ